MDQPSPHPLTDQQGRAVSCRDVSVVLSSGAGCGKTHVLTQRYLSHLREGAEVGQVVAITFTDRAARQMRERIRQGLHTLLHAAAEDEVERWSAHLRGLETAQICTIHAFCGTLLRQYAIEAGIDPGFDVLEDVLSVNLETEALTTCLQRLLPAANEPGEDLRQLVLLYGWKPVNEALQQLLAAIPKRFRRYLGVDGQGRLDRATPATREEFSACLQAFAAEHPNLTAAITAPAVDVNEPIDSTATPTEGLSP